MTPLRSSILAIALCLAALPHATLADAGDERAVVVPNTVQQGGLLMGRLPPGSRLWLEASEGSGVVTPVRVAAGGDFVIGVGRDQRVPLRLRLQFPDGVDRVVPVAVAARDWRIERIQGVPEQTVNPRPDIAARIEREQAQVSAVRTRDDDRQDFLQTFQWPVTGRISGVYGSQRVYNGTPKSPHSGLDVAVAKGTPIRAPAGGLVTFAQPDLYLTGGTVLIDHGHGLSSNFLHLSRLDVDVGDTVAQGEVIGAVGATGRATGPHMHWGMNWFGVRVDPQLLVDPTKNRAVTPAAATSTGAAPSR